MPFAEHQTTWFNESVNAQNRSSARWQPAALRRRSLRRLRNVDRLADAQAKGEVITANVSPVVFDQPDWLAGELAALAAAKDAKA